MDDTIPFRDLLWHLGDEYERLQAENHQLSAQKAELAEALQRLANVLQEVSSGGQPNDARSELAWLPPQMAVCSPPASECPPCSRSRYVLAQTAAVACAAAVATDAGAVKGFGDGLVCASVAPLPGCLDIGCAEEEGQHLWKGIDPERRKELEQFVGAEKEQGKGNEQPCSTMEEKPRSSSRRVSSQTAAVARAAAVATDAGAVSGHGDGLACASVAPLPGWLVLSEEEEEEEEHLRKGSRTSLGSLQSQMLTEPTFVVKQRTMCSTYQSPGAIGQFGTSVELPVLEPRKEWTFEEVVMGNRFETFSSVLNLTSAMAHALEVQYTGIGLGYDLGYQGSCRSAEQAWPFFSGFNGVVDIVFGLLFTTELLFKGAVLRRRLFKSAWSWLDILAVAGWWFEKALTSEAAMNPMAMRLLRLAKLGRIARKLKTVKALDSLQVLVGSIMASMSVLAWSVILLLIIQMLCAFLLNNFLHEFMVNEAKPHDKRELVYMYFGTFTRSMFSMFELTLGNWIPITRLLIEDIDEWWAVPMMVYKMFMGFAVVKVITGVFMHETFKVAGTDEELMVVQKTRAMAKYKQQMLGIFSKADKDRDGVLSRTELGNILNDAKTKTLLAAMDLEVNDSDLLYEFIRAQDNEVITLQDLTDGVQRLKGSARSIDVVALMRKTLNLEHIMQDVRNTLVDLRSENRKMRRSISSLPRQSDASRTPPSQTPVGRPQSPAR